MHKAASSSLEVTADLSSSLLRWPFFVLRRQLTSNLNPLMTPPSLQPEMPLPVFEAADYKYSAEQVSSSNPAPSMLKIQSILNPTASSEAAYPRIAGHSTTFSPPLTPALTSTNSTPSFSPHTGTPDYTSPPKRQKLIKDAAVFVKGEARGRVHYAPFESNEDTISLPPWLRDELAQQHNRFRIYPSGSERDGLISDFTRHIPYSSDKKNFSGKSGFEGFDVFQYTFVVPDDATRKEHTVMWDYNSGLVRITPFFKACKYSKTTPAKALNANSGLKDMSPSITGGALVAQGYWMPYSCARAICLTFAYPIRWALTPIFGPSFIRECLKPTHPGFARFKVGAETIHCAKMAMEGGNSGVHDQKETPRSVPDEHHHVQHANTARPMFKAGSPFDSDSGVSNASNPYGLATYSSFNSSAISPRTTAFEGSGWTTINNHANTTSKTPPPAPPITRVSSLDTSLLATPPSAARRTAHSPAAGTSTTVSAKRNGHGSAGDDDAYSEDASISSSDASSEGDGVVLKFQSKPTPRDTASRQQHGRGDSSYAAASRSATPPLKRSKKYTAGDYRAARLLLELSQNGGASIGGMSGIKGTGKGKGKGW